MQQPLVTRPAYGQGRSATPVAESKLPSGTPGGKGLPLDDSIPGGATYAKPEEDIRHDKPDDSSIYKVDGPGDIAKDQTRPDERDHQDFKPRYEPPGQDTTPKTRYPYRDGIPHAHNARTLTMGPRDAARQLRTLIATLEAPRPDRNVAAAVLRRVLVGMRPATPRVAADIASSKRFIKNLAADLLDPENETPDMTTAIFSAMLKEMSLVLIKIKQRSAATLVERASGMLSAETGNPASLDPSVR